MPQKTLRSTGIVLFIAVASGVLVSQIVNQAQAQNRPKGQALKIGVVDIGDLFKKYKRKDTFEKDINDQRERLKKELEGEKKRLVKKRKEFDSLPFRKGSEPWLRAREELKIAQFRWELKGERMQKGLRNEVEHNTLQILQELESTISVWGKSQGYDLILKIDKAKRAGAGGGAGGDLVEHFQERIFRAQISDVLYYNQNALDVTQSVLRYLNLPANLRYQERQAKKKKIARRSRGTDKPKEPK